MEAESAFGTPKRSWLQRLGLQAPPPGPESAFGTPKRSWLQRLGLAPPPGPESAFGAPKRSWLQRLGLQAPPDPDAWVWVASGRIDGDAGSKYADHAVSELTRVGIEAQQKPYLLHDHDGLNGGFDNSSAEWRVRVAVLVRNRDLQRATELLRPPAREPISDEELARQSMEAYDQG